MNGGTIEGNSATYGGGVFIDKGLFVMNNGKISNNTGEMGAAICVGEKARFEYAGGTIDGEIALNSSATFIISKEPETPFDINFIGDPPDGKIAKLEGIDTIDLSKINLTSHPDAQLSIRDIDGEKWIVMGATRTITIEGDDVFNIVYKITQNGERSEPARTITLQVPDGTIIKTENNDVSRSELQIGDMYIWTTKVKSSHYGTFLWWLFYEGQQRLDTLPITVKADMKIRADITYEPTSSGTSPTFLPTDHPEHKEKHNEYYVENKKTTIKSERKSRV